MRPGNSRKVHPQCPVSGLSFADLAQVECYNFVGRYAQARPVRAFLMLGARMQLRFLIAAAAACLLAGPCQADQPKAKVRHALAPVAATPPPAAPAMPLRPEQMPATPPQVVFENGLLTVTAQNSTLGDILRAVRNQTGAVVEIPANATERVVGNFGPGPARDVLSAMLNGSHFNYVLLGSATNPDALERVILIVKSSTTEATATTETASTKPPGPADNPGMANEEAEQAPEANDMFAEEPAAQADDQPVAPFGQPPATRTPEQMLQDLQQQQNVQQQIQQRQQQLGNPGSVPGPRALPPGSLVQPPQPQ
jgi:hypothetical protein